MMKHGWWVCVQVFDMLMGGSDLVKTLHSNTKYFRSILEEAGFSLKVQCN